MENILFLFEDTVPEIPTETSLAHLTPQRLQRARKYKKETDRRICALSEILLFYALRTLGAPEMQVFWDNKPTLSNDNYHFGLSHTQNQIALLCSSVPVGVDIEIPRVMMKKDALCKKLLTENERHTVLTDEDFFRMWTAKEAYVKYTGEGFSRPFSSFSVDFSEHAVFDGVTGEKKAHIAPFTAFNGTVGCVCTKVPMQFRHITVKASDVVTEYDSTRTETNTALQAAFNQSSR